MRQPTLEEVAARAGVSKMTASRALRGARDVSAASIEKVKVAAEQLGYVGNQLALSLSSRRTNLIGVVIPSMSNIVFPEVLGGIISGLEGSGLQPVFGVSDYDLDKERDIIRNMLSWKPAALIITGLDQPEETRKLLRQSDIPVIQIMDLDGEPIDFVVGLSHTQAGSDMAEAILASGRKRIGYIGSAVDRDRRAIKRRAGFEAALQDNGLTFVSVETSLDASSSRLGRDLTERLLARNPDLDCIYCSNDDMAAGSLFACIKLGRDVPDEILIAGFNGLEITSALPVRIATSTSPRRAIGEQAAQLALAAMNGNGKDLARRIELRAEITLGDAEK